MSSCNSLYLFLSVMSALPAILCSLTLLIVLMMMEKLSIQMTLILVLVLIIIGLIPVFIDYFFKKHLPTYLSNCMNSTTSNNQARIRRVPSSNPPPMDRRMSARETHQDMDDEDMRYGLQHQPHQRAMIDEDDLPFINAGLY